MNKKDISINSINFYDFSYEQVNHNSYELIKKFSKEEK